jgi:hypothetical protein
MTDDYIALWIIILFLFSHSWLAYLNFKKTELEFLKLILSQSYTLLTIKEEREEKVHLFD